MEVISESGFREVMIFSLGLNIAWMETALNAIRVEGTDALMGWPVVHWYLNALEWFWIHFVLTIIIVGVLLYTENLWRKDK